MLKQVLIVSGLIVSLTGCIVAPYDDHPDRVVVINQINTIKNNIDQIGKKIHLNIRVHNMIEIVLTSIRIDHVKKGPIGPFKFF